MNKIHSMGDSLNNGSGLSLLVVGALIITAIAGCTQTMQSCEKTGWMATWRDPPAYEVLADTKPPGGWTRSSQPVPGDLPNRFSHPEVKHHWPGAEWTAVRWSGSDDRLSSAPGDDEGYRFVASTFTAQLDADVNDAAVASEFARFARNLGESDDSLLERWANDFVASRQLATDVGGAKAVFSLHGWIVNRRIEALFNETGADLSQARPGGVGGHVWVPAGPWAFEFNVPRVAFSFAAESPDEHAIHPAPVEMWIFEADQAGFVHAGHWRQGEYAERSDESARAAVVQVATTQLGWTPQIADFRRGDIGNCSPLTGPLWGLPQDHSDPLTGT
jgi:hypothetical protein